MPGLPLEGVLSMKSVKEIGRRAEDFRKGN